MKIRADIPIILCTGFSEQITEERAKELGIREYILKPIVLNKLADIIHSVLDGG
jgi:CheY-like chemotaxis protein